MLLTVPTIFRTEFSLRLITDTAAQVGCLDTLAFALDVVSSPDSLARFEWQAKGYYHNSTSPQGQDWVGANGSLGFTIGAPQRDTLYFTRHTLDTLGASGSQIGWDSVLVGASLLSDGGAIAGVRLPLITVDSLGCFHPSPATSTANGTSP